MKTSLSWLQTHLDLSGRTTAQLSDLLTFAGIEVEGIEEKGVDSDKIVVGQILESVQHPNADRLSVCQVDDGSGKPRQIVCGAKNYKVGDKVPVALPGVILPGNFEIKDLPAGEHEFKVWHENSGYLVKNDKDPKKGLIVTIKDGEKLDLPEITVPFEKVQPKP